MIPCYNAAAFLTEALESVRAQTLPVAQILVVDDGSQDDSAAIAERWGATVLRTSGQLGSATARNLGARVARTPYLAFLDADDSWLPHHCETLITLFRANPDAVAAFGRIQQFGPRGDIPTRPTGSPQDGTLPELLFDNPIPQSASLVHRDTLLAAGGYREDMRHAEDYDLWLRLAEQHSILACDAVTCRYRVHPGQISRDLKEMIKGAWEARMASRDRLRTQGKYSAEHERMLALALQSDMRTAWTVADRRALELLFTIANRIASPSDKLILARNGIPDWIHARPHVAEGRQPERPFTLVHAGSLYMNRDPIALLDGLALLVKRRGLGPREIQLQLIGRCREYKGRPVTTLVEERGLSAMVRFEDWLPHEEVRRRMLAADALVLFAQRQPLQIPNKLYEYLATRVAILAFVDREGESASLLRETGGAELLYDPDPALIAHALESLYDGISVAANALSAQHLEARARLSTTAQMRTLVSELEQRFSRRMPARDGSGP